MLCELIFFFRPIEILNIIFAKISTCAKQKFLVLVCKKGTNFQSVQHCQSKITVSE